MLYIVVGVYIRHYSSTDNEQTPPDTRSKESKNATNPSQVTNNGQQKNCPPLLCIRSSSVSCATVCISHNIAYRRTGIIIYN